MNYRDKTNEELIDDLKKLKQAYDSLKKCCQIDTSQTLQEKKLPNEDELWWYTLVKTIPDFIAIHDIKGNYIFLNHYAKGFTEKDVIGTNLYDYLSDESKNIFRVNFEECIRTKENKTFEYEAFGDDKMLKTYESCLVPIMENGNVVNVMSIARDITDRKSGEEKLKASEYEYRTLFENSIIGISQAYPGGGLLRINKAYAEMYGYPDTSTMLNEISGNTKVLFSNTNDRKRVLEALGRKDSIGPAEFELNRRDGEKFWALVGVKQVRDNTGRLIYLQAEHIDITRQKKMEDELRRSKKLLEKLNKHLVDIRENERNQIALNLHDDLGQKLTAINLNITWIKSRIGVQSKAVRERIEEMSTIINESIESIREISSFLRPTILFDLGLVPAFTWQLKRFEQQSGIKCYFHHEPEEFKVDTPVSLILFRVLQESLTNIARHSEASESNITLRTVKNKIEMLIKDNGIGIDEKKALSIMSMGLAGIRERVRSVRGSVIIKGKKGSWTFIKVSIPFKNRKKDD